MAHKKGQGSSRNGRDSPGQHRGIKIYGGESVISGNIIVRQVGTLVHPGVNVGMGKDFTIFAVAEGLVKYERLGKDRKRVSVYPVGDARLTATRDARPPKKAKPAGEGAPKAEGKPAAKPKAAKKPEAKA